MRIAYFAHVFGGAQSGVFHKIAAQLEQWRARGNVARLFLITQDNPVEWQSRVGDSYIRQYRGPTSRLKAITGLVQAMRQFRPSIVYMRLDVFYPQLLLLPRSPPLVIEVNTDDIGESVHTRKVRAFYHAHTRGLLLGRASGIVFISAELSNLATFRRFPARRIAITNGINLSAYPELPAPGNDRPRLAFVGSDDMPWHGVDKLVELASVRPDWDFDVVGMHQTASESSSNITWHGPLKRDGVLRVLAGADIGIGSLALYRNGMSEGSTLKVREYLAVGLPVMYAYRDADADMLGRYALRIANTPTGVMDELPRIDAFVACIRGERVPRSAVSHIDVSQKEQQRLALFQDLADA